jgi:hypothetical protein
MTELVVVIVNWQRPNDTIECIQSLKNAGVTAGEILLVDNGSQDSSVEHILSAHPGIQVESLPQNLGFAGGYNAGITLAMHNKADYIFLLNNDTTLDPHAITALRDSGWDVAIPKILFYDQPEIIWAAGARWRVFPPAVVMNGYLKADGPAHDQSKALRYATGCAILARRQVFEALGGFDQNFENYMEDYDLFFRIHASGYRVGYVPQARVYHKVSQTLGIQSPLRWRYLGRNTVLFYLKDRRFSVWMLWCYLGWFFVREIFKGNARSLPMFWAGIKEGLVCIKGKEKEELGSRSLHKKDEV